MSSFVRRLFTVCVFFVALGALVGCSKKEKTSSDPGLTQTEADDLMMTLMAEAATDSGGWLVEVASTLQGTPIGSAPALGVSAIGATNSRDTMFTTPSGNMTWTMKYTYYNGLGQPRDAPNDSTIRVEAVTEALGTFTLTPFGGASGHGNYHRRTDNFTMEGLASLDTALVFHNSAFADSGLFAVQTATQTRYYLLDNIVSYDLTLKKSLLSSPPTAADAFKATGQVEINAFVSVLPSFAPGPSTKLIDALMVITFDGTDTPLASITADTDPPTAVFRYLVNLKTGTITRQ